MYYTMKEKLKMTSDILFHNNAVFIFISDILSLHDMYCDVVSCHITSCHTILCRVMSFRYEKVN